MSVTNINPTRSPLVSVKHMAETLGYSEWYVRYLARQNKIPYTRRGRLYLFDEAAVLEALEIDFSAAHGKPKEAPTDDLLSQLGL